MLRNRRYAPPVDDAIQGGDACAAAAEKHSRNPGIAGPLRLEKAMVRHQPQKKIHRALRLDTFIPYQMSLLTHQSTLANSELAANHHRLTVQEWRVFSIVADKGPLMPAEIRRLGTQDKSTISWAIKRLQHRDMLVRRSRAHDGRTFEVSLSEDGWDYYKAVIPLARRKARALLRRLTPAELAELRRLLAKLGHT